MLKLLLNYIIFITLFSFSALGVEREIVILTSFNEKETKDTAEYIEKKFNRSFEESGYKLVFNHSTNMMDLSKYLMSPKTLGLFWISHASGSSKNGLNGAIIDAEGNDVKRLFQKVNPNILFISIIGCQAQSIINDYKKKNYYNGIQTQFQAFSKKLFLSTGIRRGIKFSAKFLDQDPKTFMNRHPHPLRHKIRPYRQRIKIQGIHSLNFLEKVIPTPLYNNGREIEIYNTNENINAQIVLDDHLVGILTASKEAQKFIIPKSMNKKKKLKVEVIYENKENNDRKHTLEFNTDFFEIDYFSNANGEIFGEIRNIYYLFPVD